MRNIPQQAFQPSSWTTPLIISTSPVSDTVASWFPDLTVDEFKTVHVVWCRTRTLVSGVLQEQVSYTHLTSAGWSPPNDIVPPSGEIVRNAITTDLNGHVLLLYGGSVHGRFYTLYFSEANVDDAWSAQAWPLHIQLNRGVSYMSDIAIDSHGAIHVIYDDTINKVGPELQVVYADIYYRKSIDGGKTWSGPVNLSNSPKTGSARPSLKIDANDTIHVTWDEGWDRITVNEAKSLYSVYINSKDGGESWSDPKIVTYPNEATEQLTVGSNGKGGVMLVWRSKLDQTLYSQWSQDGGVTWPVMPTIHDVFARPWTIPYDMYDMATDSNGNIHLILVGQANKADLYPGVYHIVWDGKQWSTPEKIFSAEYLNPEYPKIVISEGNQIHVTWYTRQGSVWNSTNHQVWYSSSQANAPKTAIHSPPTPTIPQPTFTKTPRPTATPRPTISSARVDVNSPTKENEYLKIVSIGLFPVIMLLGILIIVTILHSRNR